MSRPNIYNNEDGLKIFTLLFDKEKVNFNSLLDLFKVNYYDVKQANFINRKLNPLVKPKIKSGYKRPNLVKKYKSKYEDKRNWNYCIDWDGVYDYLDSYLGPNQNLIDYHLSQDIIASFKDFFRILKKRNFDLSIAYHDDLIHIVSSGYINYNIKSINDVFKLFIECYICGYVNSINNAISNPKEVNKNYFK